MTHEKKKQGKPYTKQYCSNCKKTIEIDAFDFLMSLDESIICEDCKTTKTIIIPKIRWLKNGIEEGIQ